MSKGIVLTVVIAAGVAYLFIWLDNRGKLPGAMPSVPATGKPNG